MINLDIPSINRNYLYEKHLNEMINIKFTVREIDVMSCILYNRTEKKIAVLLSISHRTISVHVRNIMGKIGVNSKDALIDSIEKSGNLSFLRKYYFELLTTSVFKRFLVQVGSINNANAKKCDVFFRNLSENELLLVEDIIKYLKLANIDIKINPSQSLIGNNNLHIVGQGYELNNKIINNHSFIVSLPSNKNEDLLKDKNFIRISFGREYYLSIIELLKKLIDHKNLEKIIDKFTNEYDLLFKSYNDINSGNEKKESDRPTENFNKKNPIIIFTSLAFIAILLNFLFSFRYTSENFQETSDKSEHQSDTISFSDINSLLEEYTQKISADNVFVETLAQNQEVVKILEELINCKNINDLKKYFFDSKVPSKYLVNYLYHLHALASYYMYNDHDGQKANETLTYAKDLMESYVNIKSKIRVNFDKITPEEMFSELKIIKNFPQIYTRIIYSLGRTYIYLGEGEKGRKYFMDSKILGKKLNLLEGYLSDNAGILVLDIIKSEEYIENNQLELATELLKNIISTYKELESDSNIYIKDFVPGKDPQELISVKDQTYSTFDRLYRIVSCYGKLIKIGKNTENRLDYIASLTEFLERFFQKLNFASCVEKLSSRKVAMIYNGLGDIYLNLYHFGIHAKDLNKVLNKNIKLALGNNLEIAENLYVLAKNMSRNTDFTKADSCDGLANVYKEKLHLISKLSQSQLPDKKDHIESLNKNIKHYETKRDHINQKLKRKN